VEVVLLEIIKVWENYMIPLEQQVVSLELAKRLKELGVKQESLFYWDSHAIDNVQNGYGLTENGEYSAFTVAELGELLPYSLDRKLLKTAKGADGSWAIFYVEFGGSRVTRTIEDQTAATEANARACMLIHLLENHLIKVTN